MSRSFAHDAPFGSAGARLDISAVVVIFLSVPLRLWADVSGLVLAVSWQLKQAEMAVCGDADISYCTSLRALESLLTSPSELGNHRRAVSILVPVAVSHRRGKSKSERKKVVGVRAKADD